MTPQTPEPKQEQGAHPCEHPGCTCPDYVSGGAAFDFCQREGCGHRDLEHQL